MRAWRLSKGKPLKNSFPVSHTFTQAGQCSVLCLRQVSQEWNKQQQNREWKMECATISESVDETEFHCQSIIRWGRITNTTKKAPKKTDRRRRRRPNGDGHSVDGHGYRPLPSYLLGHSYHHANASRVRLWSIEAVVASFFWEYWTNQQQPKGNDTHEMEHAWGQKWT